MSSRLFKNIWSGWVICPIFSSSDKVGSSLRTCGSNDERRWASGTRGMALKRSREASREPTALSEPSRN